MQTSGQPLAKLASVSGEGYVVRFYGFCVSISSGKTTFHAANVCQNPRRSFSFFVCKVLVLDVEERDALFPFAAHSLSLLPIWSCRTTVRCPAFVRGGDRFLRRVRRRACSSSGFTALPFFFVSPVLVRRKTCGCSELECPAVLRCVEPAVPAVSPPLLCTFSVS